jgi:hypothetical protein
MSTQNMSTIAANRDYALFVDGLMDSTNYRQVGDALRVASEIISDLPRVKDIKITHFRSGSLMHHWHRGSWRGKDGKRYCAECDSEMAEEGTGSLCTPCRIGEVTQR